MEEYNYKLESALKRAVHYNKKYMNLKSRLDAENALLFVEDLLHAYGDIETAKRINALRSAVDNLDTNILVKAGIFEQAKQIDRFGGLSLCLNSANFAPRMDFYMPGYTVVRVNGFYTNLGKIEGRL